MMSWNDIEIGWADSPLASRSNVASKSAWKVARPTGDAGEEIVCERKLVLVAGGELGTKTDGVVGEKFQPVARNPVVDPNGSPVSSPTVPGTWGIAVPGA